MRNYLLDMIDPWVYKMGKYELFALIEDHGKLMLDKSLPKEVRKQHEIKCNDLFDIFEERFSGEAI